VQKILTQAGEYKVFRGDEATPRREPYQPQMWYFEPETYVGFTIFSEAFETLEDAKKAALETGAREERLGNEIGGGG
jgi:hypothetical protein